MPKNKVFKKLSINQLLRDGYFPNIFSQEAIFSLKQTDADWESICPINGECLSRFHTPHIDDIDGCVDLAQKAFYQFRQIPAPQRGELVRRIGLLAREHKEELAHLVTLESGKIYQEALGEVQEMIDVCDFATGLSRQLHGLCIASERPQHRMMEQWHPLGVVVIISAFNFPMAVWAWNAMLALVCGNAIIWKPSSQTPLCALACQQLVNQACLSMEGIPHNISTVLQGDRHVVSQLANSSRVALVSATGSCAMGKQVNQMVAARLGRCLLELGGNNAMIVSASADLDLALRAIVFSAVGTCGQRCTSLRRLIVHKSIKGQLTERLIAAYESLKIGDPFDSEVLVGPLVNHQAFDKMQAALQIINIEGGKVVYGGEAVTDKVPALGYYVKPALVDIASNASIVQEETFAPILYIMEYEHLMDAFSIHNNVPQGLSSAIFTNNIQEAELFLSVIGSDCGIANVNIGTSGAEIGGAFGGEKDTGGGRESGSDAWKNYMRRATNTINYGNDIPLAQGINFG